MHYYEHEYDNNKYTLNNNVLFLMSIFFFFCVSFPLFGKCRFSRVAKWYSYTIEHFFGCNKRTSKIYLPFFCVSQSSSSSSELFVRLWLRVPGSMISCQTIRVGWAQMEGGGGQRYTILFWCNRPITRAQRQPHKDGIGIHATTNGFVEE